jgi:hypothetical protein
MPSFDSVLAWDDESLCGQTHHDPDNRCAAMDGFRRCMLNMERDG